MYTHFDLRQKNSPETVLHAHFCTVLYFTKKYMYIKRPASEYDTQTCSWLSYLTFTEINGRNLNKWSWNIDKCKRISCILVKWLITTKHDKTNVWSLLPTYKNTHNVLFVGRMKHNMIFAIPQSLSITSLMCIQFFILLHLPIFQNRVYNFCHFAFCKPFKQEVFS